MTNVPGRGEGIVEANEWKFLGEKVSALGKTVDQRHQQILFDFIEFLTGIYAPGEKTVKDIE
jgi:hypothetical protein